MGKKKDKEFKASPFDYMGGGRIRELGDRLGVDASDYNINYGRTSGSGRNYKGDRDDYDKAVALAANDNYSMRRTAEAQAMAGNKDFKKFAKKGFKNVGKVYEANELMRDLHKEAGNGGSFSSASDYAGVTHRSVQADRKAEAEQYKNDFALGADLAALREEMDTRFDEHKENTLPTQLAADPPESSPTDDYELNLGTVGNDIFGSGSPQEQAQADEFKTNAVAQVKKGIQLSDVETRGPKSGVIPGTGF